MHASISPHVMSTLGLLQPPTQTTTNINPAFIKLIEVDKKRIMIAIVSRR